MGFLQNAAAELGTPYRYGGDTPSSGFDCSGLPHYLASLEGITIPRTSEQQYAQLPATSTPGPADLVFFDEGGGDAGHVGICVNEGCTVMIDAPHTGAVVRQEQVAGFGPVLGYRQIPGLAGKSSALTAGNGTVTDAGLHIPGLSDIQKLPADFVKAMLGGHSPGEIVVRTLEVVGGAVIFAAGLVMFARRAGARNPAPRAKRAARTVKKVHDRRVTARATREDLELEQQAREERRTNAAIAARKRRGVSEYNDHAPRARRTPDPVYTFDDGSTF